MYMIYFWINFYIQGKKILKKLTFINFCYAAINSYCIYMITQKKDVDIWSCTGILDISNLTIFQISQPFFIELPTLTIKEISHISNYFVTSTTCYLLFSLQNLSLQILKIWINDFFHQSIIHTLKYTYHKPYINYVCIVISEQIWNTLALFEIYN